MPPVADFMLFYAEKDKVEATTVMEDVVRECSNNQLPIIGYLYDDDGIFGMGSELSKVENIRNISVQKWFYITDNFIADQKMQHFKDEELTDNNNNNICPVWTRNRRDFEKKPYGLTSYVGLCIENGINIKKIVNKFKTSNHRAERKRLEAEQEKAMERESDVADVQQKAMKGEHEIVAVQETSSLQGDSHTGNTSIIQEVTKVLENLVSIFILF